MNTHVGIGRTDRLCDGGPFRMVNQSVYAPLRSVVGIGSTVGAIGGMLGASSAGYLLESSNGYVLHFIVAGSVYLVALCLMHCLSPRLERATVPHLSSKQVLI